MFDLFKKRFLTPQEELPSIHTPIPVRIIPAEETLPFNDWCIYVRREAQAAHDKVARLDKQRA